MKKLILIVIVFSILIAGCKKSQPTTPPTEQPTMNGTWSDGYTSVIITDTTISINIIATGFSGTLKGTINSKISNKFMVIVTESTGYYKDMQGINTGSVLYTAYIFDSNTPNSLILDLATGSYPTASSIYDRIPFKGIFIPYFS